VVLLSAADATVDVAGGVAGMTDSPPQPYGAQDAGPGAERTDVEYPEIPGAIAGAAATQTDLNALPPSIVPGQSVTITARVGAAYGSGTPTGQVVFQIDGVETAPVSLVGGTASYTTAFAGLGPHPVRAFYSGDIFWGPSTGNLTLPVGMNDTTTRLNSSANPSVFGQAVTFTATVVPVSPSTGTLRGQVTFMLDGTPAATVNLSNGSATWSPTALTVGTHAVTASWSGDDNDNPSDSSTLTQTVNKANTSVALAFASPVEYGQSVTATVHVQPVLPGAGLPTGTVVLRIDGRDAARQVLAGGQAIFTVAPLLPGQHSLVVSYTGDDDFNGNTSPPRILSVNKIGSSTSLSLHSPVAFGQPIELTAGVTGLFTLSALPGGTVLFRVDGHDTMTGTLANGQVTVSLSGVSVGQHTIEAIYSGDDYYKTSTSPTEVLVVTRADTTTALSFDSPVPFGQAANLRTAVASLATSDVQPEGSVTFQIDGRDAPDVTLAGGEATFSISGLSPGRHTIQARYAGNDNWNPSRSTTQTLVINQAETTTTLSFPTPVNVGQAVTLQANVTSVAPGVDPTGEVIFRVDGNDRASRTLHGGQVSFTLTDLSVGSHTLSARYAGDDNLQESTSGPQALVVTRADTTTDLSFVSPATFGQAIALTARVTSQAGTPTGSVTFQIDGQDAASGMLDNGQVRVMVSGLALGQHTVQAVYSGDDNDNDSHSSAQTLEIGKADTTTTITLTSGLSSNEPLAFTVTVAASPAGPGTPTGTVAIQFDGTEVLTEPLTNGQARVSLPPLTLGSHTLEVVYSGDEDYNGSRSLLLLSLPRTDTSTRITVQTDAAGGGSQVLVEVSSRNGDSGPPTGEVTALINGRTVTGTLSNGVAVFSVPDTVSDLHSVQAFYQGNENWAPSQATWTNYLPLPRLPNPPAVVPPESQPAPVSVTTVQTAARLIVPGDSRSNASVAEGFLSSGSIPATLLSAVSVTATPAGEAGNSSLANSQHTTLLSGGDSGVPGGSGESSSTGAIGAFSSDSREGAGLLTQMRQLQRPPAEESSFERKQSQERSPDGAEDELLLAEQDEQEARNQLFRMLGIHDPFEFTLVEQEPAEDDVVRALGLIEEPAPEENDPTGWTTIWFVLTVITCHNAVMDDSSSSSGR
jgi:flagellar hook assembly protein FlgD